MTDMGPHIFSPESAKLLMSSQAKRGNKFSIDVDHMSFNKESPPESRKAVGWHALGVRDAGEGPELWAVDVEWTDAVRAGLEKSPPEWRYFSPAYDVNKKTGEIIAYLNTALTNNPATHRVTALASQSERKATQNKGFHMDFKKMAGALAGDDDDEKKAAKEWLSKASEVEKKAWKAWKKAAFDDSDGEKKDEGEKEANKASEGEEEEKKAAVQAALTALGFTPQTIGAMKSILANQAKIEVTNILATRPDLDEKTKAFLAGLPTEQVKAAVEALPKVQRVYSQAAAGSLASSGIRGENQGNYDPQVSAHEQALLDKFMPAPSGITNYGPTGLVTTGSGDVNAARRHLAARAAQLKAAG